MKRLAIFFENQSLPLRVASVLAILGVVGVGDYLIGYELSFLIFYLLPIVLGRWFVGVRFSILIALLSIVIWITGDWLAGEPVIHPLILGWNALVSFGFFVVVIMLVGYQKADVEELERRVAQRTLDLTNEIAERRRLEREILGISEREQFRFGHDLHDTVCQHLTGTVFAAEVLEEKMEKNGNAATADLRKIVSLIEEANDLARRLAKGLSPVEITPDGLMDALHDLAAYISHHDGIFCELDYDEPLLLPNVETAMHIYRIIQEAVTNVIKHAKADKIIIGINQQEDVVELTIQDNGIGYKQAVTSKGMGTRIMAYRASMIGASLEIRQNINGGTIVACHLPKSLLHTDDKIKGTEF